MTAEFKGPFFKLGTQPLVDAQAETIRDLVKEGEARVKAQLYPGHGVDSGAYKAGIRGRIEKSAHGGVTKTAHGLIENNGAVYGPWLEGGARGKRFKGYRAFRLGKQHLRRVAKETAGHRYARAVKRYA
jgi:hypothetical protein